jgi:phosphate transport system substrate-binding protein
MKTAFQILLLSFALTLGGRADILTVAGASSVGLPLSDAAAILKTEQKMEINVTTDGGSDGGIDGLGDNRVDVAMVADELTGQMRARYPDVIFTPTFIGRQVVVLAVSPDVWAGGIHSLNAEQMRKIYQKRVTNWKELGGPDRPISFLDWSHDSGLWEMLMNWVYGDSRRAPPTKYPVSESAEAALKMLSSTPGAMVVIPANLKGAPKGHFLALADEDGSAIAPTLEAIAQDQYPLDRPLLLVTNNRPTNDARTLVEFMLGPRGQALVRKYGYFAADDLKAAHDPHLNPAE